MGYTYYIFKKYTLATYLEKNLKKINKYRVVRGSCAI